MLNELREGKNFTAQEQNLADFILDNIYNVITMSGNELAKAALVSPSTISRLSKKVGAANFNDMKIRLSREIGPAALKNRAINVNVPFTHNDSKQTIIDNISKISVNTILLMQEHLNLSALLKAASFINKSKYINIYGVGSSLSVAYPFYDKMSRIGYCINIDGEQASQFYKAVNSTREHCSVFISYSGETPANVAVARVLKENALPIIVITRHTDSTLARLASCVIPIYSEENDTMTEKIDVFASEIAVQYILNCLFGLVYSFHYKEYEEIRRERETLHYNYLFEDPKKR